MQKSSILKKALALNNKISSQTMNYVEFHIFELQDEQINTEIITVSRNSVFCKQLFLQLWFQQL